MEEEGRGYTLGKASATGFRREIRYYGENPPPHQGTFNVENNPPQASVFPRQQVAEDVLPWNRQRMI